MKKIIIRGGIVLIVLVVAALAVVFFSLNSIVKKGVETVGPQITKVPVTLGAAEISPFSGSGRLTKFVVGNPDGYKTPSAIQVGDVKLGVKIGSVFSDTIEVSEINIQSPEITLEGTLDGNNLSKILDNIKGSGGAKEKAAAAPASSKPAKKFIVKDIVLAGAKVNVNVSGMGKSLVKTVSIPDIHLQNVGTAGNAASVEDLTRAILEPVITAAVKAATDELAGKEVEKLRQQGADQLNKAAPGLTNLLKLK
jgi:uncharacterized protein involved in outer membrane biogenesis